MIAPVDPWQALQADSGPDTAERLRFEAVPSCIREARAAAVRAANRVGLAPERVEAVRLAVSEAVTNAVRHAYLDGPGVVRVSMAERPHELVILVEDDGCGPYGSSPVSGLGLGLGWALIAQASDEFTVGSGANGGTRACLRFRGEHASR
jgi:anti-sigma regulatory factor (Ser/Thr protein kinase)